MTDKETTYVERFGDALQALCSGHRAPDELLIAWCDHESNDFRLEEFVDKHCFYWAQGIGLIDAAEIAARQPKEGVGHLPRAKLNT